MTKKLADYESRGKRMKAGATAELHATAAKQRVIL
jgi:hypothetical protein